MVAQPSEDRAEHLLFPGGNEDRELTLAFQRGEKGSYQAIYDRHSTRVHAVCRRMLLKPEDAQEAAQETFLRVYQALGRFNGRYQLGPWITRIATNICLDHLRARSRRPHDASLELLEAEADPTTEIDPETVTIRRSEGRAVRRVLRDLPPMHRAALILRDFEGLSYQEVADVLGISDAQVKALLHRARQRFKRDWTSSLAGLLPWRLVAKWRGAADVGRDHAVLGSAAQVAPTCSTAIQQCGQYVIDKLAPVLTVAFVASGAVAPVVPAASQPLRQETEVVDRDPERAVSVSDPQARVAMREKDRYRRSRSLPSQAERPTKKEATPPAVPAPSATPTPSASPSTPPEQAPPDSASGGTGGSVPPGGVTAGPTPRGPFTPTIGFEWGSGIPARQPQSHAASVKCESLSISQSTRTAFQDDDAPVWYDAEVSLNGGTQISIALTVWKNGYPYRYSGTASVTKQARGLDTLDVTYAGRYSTSDPASNVDLPQGGTINASMTLHCTERVITAQTIRFGVNN